MSKNKILITGGTGFIGRGIGADDRFIDSTHIGRSMPFDQKNFVRKKLAVGERLDDVLKDVDIIIHSAGIAHASKSAYESNMDHLKKTNIDFPIYLAQEAIKHGVKRFLFISSVKVLGEIPERGKKFKYNDNYNPKDNYAKSKAIAEQELLKIVENSGMELVIIRSPLVIGKNAKGNLERFSNIAKKGIPLPFAGINNLRSVVSIENLVDLIWHCAHDKRAANKIVMVKDKQDLSTSAILQKIAFLEDHRLKMFWMPEFALKFLFGLLARRDLIEKIICSCEIDNEFTEKEIGWIAK